MLLLPTLLFASVMGNSFAGNIFMAFFVGLISFFLINLIPHWTPENFQKKSVVFIRYTDFVLAGLYFCFLIFAVLQPGFDLQLEINGYEVAFNTIHLIATLAAAILYFFFYYYKAKEIKNRYIKAFYDFGEMISYKDRSLWGLFVQFAIIVVCVTILFHLIDFPSWQKILTSL